jgi:predicted ATPase
MATLTVKNVGPIREAELEVKKHTVFIGPQGSGKSTLAKLIAIGGESNIATILRNSGSQIVDTYNLSNYISGESEWSFVNDIYRISFKDEFMVVLTEEGQEIENDKLSKYNAESGANSGGFNFYIDDIIGIASANFSNMRSYTRNYINSTFASHLRRINSIYIPTERNAISFLSNAVWGLMYSETSVPKSLSRFGSILEEARKKMIELSVDFLQIKYSKTGNADYIVTANGVQTLVSQSASGYQAIVPLLHVVEVNKLATETKFIVEEPELNLYPTAQKQLIYSLVGGLNPEKYDHYHDSEWVITTHSPYILSSYNTLMLAYKVAQKSEELREEVSKIIPERCWINPDDFAAYYVDNGTVRNIINPKTGLISDNELDDVSEQFAAEQDQLLELNRSVVRG